MRNNFPDEIVHAVGIYTDSVSFIKRDAALGFYWFNLATKRRHVILALRKQSYVVAEATAGTGGSLSVAQLLLDCAVDEAHEEEA